MDGLTKLIAENRLLTGSNNIINAEVSEETMAMFQVK
jgi:hypothetical protein